MRTTTTSRFRRAARAPLATAMLLAIAGCSAADILAVDDGSTVPAADEPSDAGMSDAGGSDNTEVGELGAVGSLASDEVHDISVDFDTADYDAMIAAYDSTGDKEWIEATVAIDGTTFEQVGLRLKGNSSLRGATDDDPVDLPWLIRLDKYVDDQDLDGLTDLVVRSNTSTTALNEAVALELLDLAGLASQDAIATRFVVNGSDAELRLVIEHPDDEWMAEEFDASGALYKAESTGDYTYRGDDPDDYDEVFDQEAGDDNADLTPLIEFLDFVNNSDDATFESELSEHLDVDAFATYLATQTLIDNFDDIDGPGNNSYLYYDPSAEQFTVVAWDHNLAFGQTNDVGGGLGGPGSAPGGAVPGDPAGAPGGAFPGGARPEGAPPGGVMPGAAERGTTGADVADVPPAGADPDSGVPVGGPLAGEAPVGGPAGGGNGGPGGGALGGNVLSERFLSVAEFEALYEQQLSDLGEALYDSGAASAVLARWTSIVDDTGLVEASVVDDEAATIAAHFE